MSRPAVTPTFISTVLDTCRAVRDGRNFDDIFLHALSELGELSLEVAIARRRLRGLKGGPRVPGPDGIAGEALDVLLCAVDLLLTLDPHASDATILDAQSQRDTFTSFVGMFLSLRPFPTDPNLRVRRISESLLRMTEETDADEDDEIDVHRLRAGDLIAGCLMMICAEHPQITEEDLIAMARPKLAKWADYTG